MRAIYKISLICLSVSCIVLSAPAVSPQTTKADIFLYLNTRQAEKNLDKALWDAIENRRKAELQKQKGMPFITSRNMEGFFKAFVDSVNPPAFRISGTAKIEDGITNELNMLKDMKNIHISERKQDNMTLYVVRIPLNETQNPKELEFHLLVSGEMVTLSLSYNQGNTTGKIPENTIQMSATQEIRLPDNRSFSNNGIVFELQTEKIIPLLKLLKPEKAKKLDFLKKFESLMLKARLSGKSLLIESEFMTDSPETAATIYKEKLLPMSGKAIPPIALDNLTATALDKKLSVSLSFNMTTISNFITNLPIIEDVPDDDNDEE